LANTNINESNAKKLAMAAGNCWDAIQELYLKKLGTSVTESFEAQIAMFPNMVNPHILKIIESYQNKALGGNLAVEDIWFWFQKNRFPMPFK
jgi:hypothetical protein